MAEEEGVQDQEEDVSGREKIPRLARTLFGQMEARLGKRIDGVAEQVQPIVDALNEPEYPSGAGMQPQGPPGMAGQAGYGQMPQQPLYTVDPQTGQLVPVAPGYPQQPQQYRGMPQMPAQNAGQPQGDGHMERALAIERAARLITYANPTLAPDVVDAKAEEVIRHCEKTKNRDIQAALLQLAKNDEDLNPYADKYFEREATAKKPAPAPEPEGEGDEKTDKQPEDPDGETSKGDKDQEPEGDADKGKKKGAGASKTPSLPPEAKEPGPGVDDRVQAQEDNINKQWA
jgi:hypothetical protein